MASQPSVSLLHFKFDDFEDLSSEVGVAVKSGVKTDRNGNAWEMKIYPGGCDHAAANRGFCSVLLVLRGKGEVELASRALIVRNEHGHVAIEKSSEGCDNGAFRENDALGCRNFAKRSVIVDNLVKGSLHIDVLLQYIIHEDVDQFHAATNPSVANMLAFLDSGDNADISFKVGDTIIPAHKLILQINAPFLASFCKGQAEGTPISIEATTPEVFRHILRYIYGGNAPDKMEIMKMGRNIIDAADRYGIVGLKVAVENTLVASCVINLSNVADYLLFADAKTCPLLKEYATSFFVARAKDILNSEYSEKLKESPKLLQELILATAENSDNGVHSYHTGVSVSELRKELGKMNLDVDGSKEMLVSRLESANKRQRTE